MLRRQKSLPDSVTASNMAEQRKITPEQKRSNARLGLILGAIAVAIFVGFIAKSAIFGM
jgi:hypothetical protein